MGPGHPERPDRLRAIEAALGSEKFKRLERLLDADGHLRGLQALVAHAQGNLFLHRAAQ